MNPETPPQSREDLFGRLAGETLSPLDFLPGGSVAEKMIHLVLTGPPDSVPEKLGKVFQETLARLRAARTDQLRVVVLGGGTGLSNIVGGDSRKESWVDAPFTGLKEVFPGITSVVCVTDDGGSTGELLKDLPLIGLGDLRHVLLSSVRRQGLSSRYGVSPDGAGHIARVLHVLFNHRFDRTPGSVEDLLPGSFPGWSGVPGELVSYLRDLLQLLFSDDRLRVCLTRSQCLGNLLLAAAVFARLDPVAGSAELVRDRQGLHEATLEGLAELAQWVGASARAVLPCTTTPAQLQVLYGNGVLVTGEEKSGLARRGVPVDRVMVGFMDTPLVPAAVQDALSRAEIIILAPGSLYSSIIPILQVPGIAEAIRTNRDALKILVTNIWVQKGETDATRDAPDRKFHVSDLVRAYHRNIPGGVTGLFSHLLTLGLGEIPGSILQNYALEDKEPIYLDRARLRSMGFEPVEAGIFSTDLLRRFRIIQHDPGALALAVRTLWCLKSHGSLSPPQTGAELESVESCAMAPREPHTHPCSRYGAIKDWLDTVSFLHAENGTGKRRRLTGAREALLRETIASILWNHPDILIEHLRFTDTVTLVAASHWSRCQEWDNVFSFYDPGERTICIREDQTEAPFRFEMAFLVALGQSLLGNYAARKSMVDVPVAGETAGRVFLLTLRDRGGWDSFFTPARLDVYLRLARMRRQEKRPGVYSRLVNGSEGFTPPGLLFGLFYAWYLDNRFASNIEYKMSILRHNVSDLIPEQVKIVGRREGLVDFFRETVFKHRSVPGGHRQADCNHFQDVQ